MMLVNYYILGLENGKGLILWARASPDEDGRDFFQIENPKLLKHSGW